MGLKYLLDTNILSEPLKLNPNPSVLARMRQHADLSATAATVWHELHYGHSRLPESRKKTLIGDYLARLSASRLDVLLYDADAAVWHARERARLQGFGFSPSFADGQIAAIARVNGLILVTRNTNDYSGFEGLLIENWFC
ncbi:MAG: PIN domain-containing protein [Leptospirales bacterium]